MLSAYSFNFEKSSFDFNKLQNFSLLDRIRLNCKCSHSCYIYFTNTNNMHRKKGQKTNEYAIKCAFNSYLYYIHAKHNKATSFTFSCVTSELGTKASIAFLGTKDEKFSSRAQNRRKKFYN